MRRIIGSNCTAIMAVLSCLLLSAPSLSEEFERSDGLAERSHMLGDWGGARSRFAQRGIIVDFSATHFYQGLTGGGRPEVRGDWESGLIGEASLTIVGDKFGLRGFAAVVEAKGRWVDSINGELGLAPPAGLVTVSGSNAGKNLSEGELSVFMFRSLGFG